MPERELKPGDPLRAPSIHYLATLGGSPLSSFFWFEEATGFGQLEKRTLGKPMPIPVAYFEAS